MTKMTAQDVRGAEPDELFHEIAKAQEFRSDIREVLRFVMKEFGGNEGFAKELWDCYIQKGSGAIIKGSANQIRILSSIMHLMEQCGEDDDDILNDEEAIEATLKSIVSEGEND